MMLDDMLYQQTFADVAPPRQKVNWSEYARSCSSDEKQIITWIINLHNGGRPFDLDPTYSIGRFWDDLPKPRYKFDLHPQTRGVVQADATHLPLANESIGSIMFDPPFVFGRRRILGQIRRRFSWYESEDAMLTGYFDALREFFRVLCSQGMVTFKCQDIMDGGAQTWSHIYIHNMAETLGFRVKDLFVLNRTNGLLWSPNMVNQRHARKNHLYFLVLVKSA